MRPSLAVPSCSSNGRPPTRRVLACARDTASASGAVRVRGMHVLEGKIAVGTAEAIFIPRISRIPGSVQRWQLSSEVALTGASIYSAALQNNPKNRPNVGRRSMLPSPALAQRSDLTTYSMYRTSYVPYRYGSAQ